MEVLEELADEPRLPDARDSEHGEELTGSVADRLVERVLQAPALPRTADHRRIEPACTSRGDHRDVDDAPGAARRLCGYDVTNNRVCGRVDDDLTRRGVVSESPGRRQRFAGGARLCG